MKASPKTPRLMTFYSKKKTSLFTLLPRMATMYHKTFCRVELLIYQMNFDRKPGNDEHMIFIDNKLCIFDHTFVLCKKGH